MAKRLFAMGAWRYRNEFAVTLHNDLLELPLKWKRPRTVFVNSMSDLFHIDVPQEFIGSVFETMAKAHWHTFQVLTKRSERLAVLAGSIEWPENVWMGVSVEGVEQLCRIDHLRSVPAAIRFLSLEPLLEPLPQINLAGVHWVIVGGESGPGATPMKAEWARDIRDQCRVAGVPFFFKQWGGTRKHCTGRLLDGRTWDEIPGTVARIVSRAAH